MASCSSLSGSSYFGRYPIPHLEIDSDDERIEELKQVHVLDRRETVPASSMTIRCSDRPIKGSCLIKIAHDATQFWYNDILEDACQYEKDIGGAVIPPPSVEKGLLSILEPRDWVMSLGGWKGMMPSEEVKEYFFNQFDPTVPRSQKFKAVKIYDCEQIFRLSDHRIHIPSGFSINGVDVTGYWKVELGKWVKVPTGRTDLSYSQILEAIKTMKRLNLTDSDIATVQLDVLGNHYREFPVPSFKKLPEKTQKEILAFLTYLNALMFGVEASGLNTALITGLMTLDLIVDGQLNYEKAFKANQDGGVYPYACFGNNQGSYSEREKILLYYLKHEEPLSMKPLRQTPSISPVALKEAIIITRWLQHNKITEEIVPYDVQTKNIKRAIVDLNTYYFSPWQEGGFSIKKFEKDS